MIEGFPDSENLSQELDEYFSQFGDVQMVSFAYKFNDTLGLIKKIIQIKSSLKQLLERAKQKKQNAKKLAKKRIKRLKECLSTITNQLQVQKFDLTDFKSYKKIIAFIIFNDPNHPKDIVNQFQKAYRRSFFQSLFCKKKKIDKKFKFKNQKLKLSFPDNPENLFWENMEYSPFSRKVKLFLIVIGVILIILVSLIINMVLTAYTESSGVKDFKCSFTTEANATDQDPLQVHYCNCSKYSFFKLFVAYD